MSGTKRSFSESGGQDQEDSGSPPPQAGDDFRDGSKRRKYSVMNNGKTKGKAKEGSIVWAKKRVRTIERMFRHSGNDLAADARNELEREMAAHKSIIADKGFQKRRSAMISKYHMVRFFERKKAARLAKQLQRQITSSTEPNDIKRLKRQLHIAQVDEAYTRHFPHIEVYVSLYGGAKSDEANSGPIAKAAIEAERPPMWSTIEAAMQEGPEALDLIRERRETETDLVANEAPKRPQKAVVAAKPKAIAPQTKPAKQSLNQQSKDKPSALNRRERRLQMRKSGVVKEKADDDDDDEGGFFEEL